MSAACPLVVPVPRWAAGATGAAFTLVAVLAWAVLAGAGTLLSADRAVSRALYAGDDRPAVLEVLLHGATAAGSGVVRGLVLLALILWLGARRRWWTVGFVAAALLVGPVTVGLEDAVGRLRPQFADGGAEYASLSFPSGHASGVAMLVTVGLLVAWPALGPASRRRWLAAGLALAVLVGLTRVWLGVHWLSDVVAGGALGLGWTLLVAMVLRRVAARRGADAGRRRREATR